MIYKTTTLDLAHLRSEDPLSRLLELLHLELQTPVQDLDHLDSETQLPATHLVRLARKKRQLSGCKIHRVPLACKPQAERSDHRLHNLRHLACKRPVEHLEARALPWALVSQDSASQDLVNRDSVNQALEALLPNLLLPDLGCHLLVP